MWKKSYQYSNYKSKQNNDDNCISSKFSWTNKANKTWVFVKMPFHKEYFLIFLQVIIFRVPTNMKKLVIVNAHKRLLCFFFSISLCQLGNLWFTLKTISIFRGVGNYFDDGLRKNEKFQKFIWWVLSFKRLYCIWPLLYILITNMLNSWTWHITY